MLTRNSRYLFDRQYFWHADFKNKIQTEKVYIILVILVTVVVIILKETIYFVVIYIIVIIHIILSAIGLRALAVQPRHPQGHGGTWRRSRQSHGSPGDDCEPTSPQVAATPVCPIGLVKWAWAPDTVLRGMSWPSGQDIGLGRAGNRLIASSNPTCVRYKTAPSWCSLGCRSRCDSRIHHNFF